MQVPHPRPRATKRPLAALVGSIPFLIALLTAAGESPPPSGNPAGPAGGPAGVILISLDTLRADHLGCYGYERDTSPAIDRFAKGATRYARAVASSSWTLPSHASMFTGRPPFEHQAHSVRRRGNMIVMPLPRGAPTLAATLAQAGFRTGAFSANVAFLSKRWRLDLGFSTYEVDHLTAEEVNDRAIRWLRAGQDEPFFLFLNYMETHQPYAATPHPGLIPRTVAPDDGRLLHELNDRVMPGGRPLPEDLAARVIDQYDTAIANLDASIGSLLEGLEKEGFLRDTVVVITSDHGEYFGEHDYVEHGKDLYEPVVRVPLILRAPGQRQGRVETLPVDSSDLPRLIGAHLPGPVARIVEERFPLAPGEHPIVSEIYFALKKNVSNPVWGHRLLRTRHAIYEWPLKYIHSSDDRHEMYDLAADPDEEHNLAVAGNPDAEKLSRRLEEWMQMRRPPERRDRIDRLDPEDLERLRSLGYID